jgi:hypothetical protein
MNKGVNQCSFIITKDLSLKFYLTENNVYNLPGIP